MIKLVISPDLVRQLVEIGRRARPNGFEALPEEALKVTFWHPDGPIEKLQAGLGPFPAGIKTMVSGHAMANAHPEILAAAPFQAPANTENGVIRTICEKVLGKVAPCRLG